MKDAQGQVATLEQEVTANAEELQSAKNEASLLRQELHEQREAHEAKSVQLEATIASQEAQLRNEHEDEECTKPGKKVVRNIGATNKAGEGVSTCNLFQSTQFVFDGEHGPTWLPDGILITTNKGAHIDVKSAMKTYSPSLAKQTALSSWSLREVNQLASASKWNQDAFAACVTDLQTLWTNSMKEGSSMEAPVTASVSDECSNAFINNDGQGDSGTRFEFKYYVTTILGSSDEKSLAFAARENGCGISDGQLRNDFPDYKIHFFGGTFDRDMRQHSRTPNLDNWTIEHRKAVAVLLKEIKESNSGDAKLELELQCMWIGSRRKSKSSSGDGVGYHHNDEDEIDLEMLMLVVVGKDSEPVVRSLYSVCDPKVQNCIRDE
ncbi:unnamed protein product [Amoebophrya sp. A25]|nr:unnamed protein product [Amoebophrya sp. A25]|eukprot:GSA25T00022075001.1